MFIMVATSAILVAYQNCAKPMSFKTPSNNEVVTTSGDVGDNGNTGSLGDIGGDTGEIGGNGSSGGDTGDVGGNGTTGSTGETGGDSGSIGGNTGGNTGSTGSNGDCAVNQSSGSTDCKFEDTDVNGVATLAYEDNYSSAGDNDYNDFLVNMKVVETYDSSGGLEKIVIEYSPKSKLSGYDHSLVLDFDGRVLNGPNSNSKENVVQAFKSEEMFLGNAKISYELFNSSLALQKSSIVTKDKDLVVFSSSKEAMRNVYKARITITEIDKTLNKLSARGGVSLNRYRTILRVIDTGYDIDISDINPNLFDGNGMPLAFFVPTDWKAPQEGQHIKNVYPKFLLHVDFMHNVLKNPSLIESNESKYWYRYPVQ